MSTEYRKTTNAVHEFIESDYKAHETFMSTEAYGQMLDSIVFTCVDILPIHKGKILLGKRARHPQADWWVFGGRMRAGEDIDAAAERLLRDEMNIELDRSKFTYLTTVMLAWKLRAHVPVDHGTHNSSVIYTLELSDEQVKNIQLNDEYVDMKLVSKEELVDNEDYHPAIRYCASLLV